ncbi:Thioredoxin reductase [Labilithrix luteola]|uniref:Thioredoxin reductase n=2 Tax=Labilithrix luteola TaxID=1391654 RepID=A0A0K1PZC0_9BACT|nr:Thioredoxin reductase [Labilithrix luteola]
MGSPGPQYPNLDGRRGQMFPALTESQIARVAAFGTEQDFEDGAIVFERGDADVPFYVVLDGQLEIVHPEGTLEHSVTVHDTGQFTGEMPMLFGRSSLVRARAKSHLRALRVEPQRFRSLVQTDPELSEIAMRAFILRRVALLSEGWGDAVVIGSRVSAETLRLQAFLVRNGQPYKYVDLDGDPDVQAMLDQFQVRVEDIPILICRGERVLRHPSEAEVADCLGLNPTIEPTRVFDVVVCGAGPAGLAAAVYAASEGLDVMIVEAASPGGQAGSSSKIENYLGFPTGISGQALAVRALAQAEKFGAGLSVAQGAVSLRSDETPLRIELEGGGAIRARAAVIATGIRYRKLDVPELARFEGVGVYYSATFVEAMRCGAEALVVVGGGNSAGQAATFLARSARHVHMLIRGPDLAESMSRYLIRRIEDTPNITLHRRTRITAVAGSEHLEEVTWCDDAGVETRRPIRHVFSMIGATPNTDWLGGSLALDDNKFVRTGLDLTSEILERERWPLARSPLMFETSQPRVFAVGDVRANSVKRVAAAVGDGSVCVQLIHKVLAE